MPRGSSRGFSATELVVTILIALILATIGAAGYRVYQRESPLRYSAQRLAHAAATARAYAISKNTPYALQLHATFQNYWIDELDPNDPSIVATSKVVAPERIGDKIRWVAAEFGSVPLLPTSVTLNQPVSIHFFPDGSADDSRLVLSLGEGAGAKHAALRIYGPTGLAQVKSDVSAPTQTLTAN